VLQGEGRGAGGAEGARPAARPYCLAALWFKLVRSNERENSFLFGLFFFFVVVNRRSDTDEQL